MIRKSRAGLETRKYSKPETKVKVRERVFNLPEINRYSPKMMNLLTKNHKNKSLIDLSDNFGFIKTKKMSLKIIPSKYELIILKGS